MQAVILAGGLGTRLRPITESIPKPMVPVGGRPYLEYQLEWLRRQEITEVVLLVGHLGEIIEKHFGDGGARGVSIRYSRERRPLGTGGALALAAPMLAETFLLLNGDSYLPVDYGPLAARLDETGCAAVLAVYDNRGGDTGVASNIALDAGGFVARYDKGSAGAALTHVDAGVLAMRRRALALAPEAEIFSLENEIYPQWIARRGLAAWPSPQRFYDMGTPRGLAMLEDFLER